MYRVISFELGSQHPEEAAAFYSKVFEWKVGEPNWDYWPVQTGNKDKPGIDGGIARSPKGTPLRVQITIEVDSIADVLAKATEHGAKQDTDIMDFGDFYLAYFYDPQGIRVGLLQNK